VFLSLWKIRIKFRNKIFVINFVPQYMNTNLRKIFLPTFWAAVVMLGMFYLWHGVLLRDLERVKLPIPYFFTLATLLYVIIAALFTIALHYTTQKENLAFKGGLMGGAIGFVIYLAVFVLGVSFSYANITHIAIDFVWQMLEQGAGGLVAGFIFNMELEREKFIKASNAI
jgi:hypothetical protein